MNPGAFLFFLPLLATLIGLSLGALVSLLEILLGDRLSRSPAHFGIPALRLGLVHGLILLFLLRLAEGRPLPGVVALLWLLLGLVSISLGLAQWLTRLASTSWPDHSPIRARLQAGLLVSWACLFPWAGQLLGLLLLLTAYGTGWSVLFPGKKSLPSLPDLPESS